MSRRKVTLTIICEDTQQEFFARRFLYGMGWNYNQLRIVKSPSGRGSGEQWVRDRYVKELKYYGKKTVDYAVVTIIDGDNYGVEGRIQQFADICTEEKIAERRSTDKIAIIVPTRNIETWITYLADKQVDEASTYAKLKYESDCKPSVNRLVEFCKTTRLPEDAPSSLKAACSEFRNRIQK